ncbi:sulfate adenylyltransferase subunit CysN [Hoeflea sp.]|uniref:sulfate adenylyltransferase subunit CysN n=1 Tax=Hoeflea sp. TaxID=1940281 RepID=UPI002AFF8D00|nr:sulfate adenylyltransferase subunit CysN [Hoeflea sp.]
MLNPAGPELSGGVRGYLNRQENKTLLRFITCGSVDDGKSTLIGRLLYDTKLIFEDQLAALESDSRKHGTAGEDIDFALLVDGLEAEREQGITIDVAYRFFATQKRKFIVADTPGHEEYTSNMATGASTAELAVVLVDARKGVLEQTRRHSHIVSLLGIRHIVLAVNKIDLMDHDQAVFDAIVEEYRAFAKPLGFDDIHAIPISARFGDNVSIASTAMPWYDGPTLIEHLESVVLPDSAVELPFRFPVQLAVRPHLDFRGFAGQIASGKVAVGDQVVVANSGQMGSVKSIVTADGLLNAAREGQAVTLVLDDEVDISRGSMLSHPDARPLVSDQFQAHVIWFDKKTLMPGRSYILRTETMSTPASVTKLKHKIDVNSLTLEAATHLDRNEIGVCNISTQMPVAFDAYRDNRATGNFTMIDRMTNATVGAGMIDYALRRADNVHLQSIDVTREARGALKHQKPAVLWFTGLSGSGKSTIANLVEKQLHALGHHTMTLDGDNVRHGLNRDLGFTEADRVENIRRVAEVARLMSDAGLIVLVSFISPFRSERLMAREMMASGEFLEIFVDTPIEECARRDPKGLYKKAMAGNLANFTGISSPYEAPEQPDIHLKTVEQNAEALAISVVEWMTRNSVGGI